MAGSSQVSDLASITLGRESNAIEPGPRLFGLTNRLRSGGPARGEELLLEFERWHGEELPRFIDLLTQFTQIIYGG